LIFDEKPTTSDGDSVGHGAKLQPTYTASTLFDAVSPQSTFGPLHKWDSKVETIREETNAVPREIKTVEADIVPAQQGAETVVTRQDIVRSPILAQDDVRPDVIWDGPPPPSS